MFVRGAAISGVALVVECHGQRAITWHMHSKSLQHTKHGIYHALRASIAVVCEYQAHQH